MTTHSFGNQSGSSRPLKESMSSTPSTAASSPDSSSSRYAPSSRSPDSNADPPDPMEDLNSRVQSSKAGGKAVTGKIGSNNSNNNNLSTPTKDPGDGRINPQSDCHLNRVYSDSRLRKRLEVIESIRADLLAETIEVPGVVVVGNQSAGKSSVLEAISGINFPRGENTCTRWEEIIYR
jgi:hypothetical protein